MVQWLNDERGEVGFGAPGTGAGAGADGSGAGAGNSGDGDGGAGDAGGTGDGGSGEQEGSKISYPSDLNKDYHGNATLMKFLNEETGEFKVGSMMQSLVHAQGMIGQDKVTIPGKDSSDADWKIVKQKLGLPETVDKYELANNMPEGLQANEAFLNEFKAHAFEAGILPKDAQSVMDFYNKSIGKYVNDDTQKSTDKLNADWDTLRKEWGGNYQQNLEVTNEALNQFTTPDQMSQLKEAGLLANPLLVKIFQNIGSNMGEGSFGTDFKAKTTMTMGEVDAEINQIWANPVYRNKQLPGHKGMTDRYLELHQIKGQMKKAAEGGQGNNFR